MANSRNNFTRKQYYRLLIVFLFSITNSFIFAVDTNEYIFSQSNDIFTQEQSSVSVTIPGYKPSQITHSVPTLPNTIQLIQSTKSASTVTNDNKTIQSTVISFTLLFENEGIYSIEPLEIIIDATETIQIPFEKFTVYPNFENLKPVLEFTPKTDLQALQTTEFILSARYIKDILDYSVELSKNALFEETKRLYDHTAKKTLSLEPINIASYNCIPFESGFITIEKITATVVDYNDIVQTITLATTEIPVLNSLSQNEVQFGKEQTATTTTAANKSTQIHNKNEEKAKDIFDKYREEQQSLKPIILISIIISIALILFGITHLVIKILKKHPIMTPIAISVIGVVLLLTTIFSWNIQNKYAITYNTNLFAIPEWESQILRTVESGSKVEVLEDIGDWYLIKKDDKTTGWVFKEDCLIIE